MKIFNYKKPSLHRWIQIYKTRNISEFVIEKRTRK